MSVGESDSTLVRDVNLDQWWTPSWLARWLVDWAQLQDDDVVLEPGAGSGAIVRAIPARIPVWAVEMDPRFINVLQEIGSHVCVTTGNFLHQVGVPRRGDILFAPTVAVMNPPYSKPRGIGAQFIRHALTFTNRAVVLIHSDVFHSKDRRKVLWQDYAILDRVCHFEDRPRFDDGSGQSPKTDYCAIEVHKRTNPMERSVALHTWVSLAEIREFYGE